MAKFYPSQTQFDQLLGGSILNPVPIQSSRPLKLCFSFTLGDICDHFEITLNIDNLQK